MNELVVCGIRFFERIIEISLFVDVTIIPSQFIQLLHHSDQFLERTFVSSLSSCVEMSNARQVFSARPLAVAAEAHSHTCH